MNEKLIRQIPIFSDLPKDEITSLAAIVRQRDIPTGKVLFREGERADVFSIIMQGEVEVIKALDTSDERLIGVEGSGSYLGEMSMLYPDQLRTASVRTRTDVLLLDMSREQFLSLIQREPTLAIHILRELIARYHNTDAATIRVLEKKNQALSQAYQDLLDAQAQLVEKEKMAHEMQMAREIQESTLPANLPVFNGWQIAASWKPARSVSGDFYDFLRLDDRRWGVVVGDVTGKGVPAALVMATSRSVLRATAAQKESPGQVLKRVNRLLVDEMPKNMFVTCLYIEFDPLTGEFSLANAGHNLPSLCSRDGVEEIRATGMPLGLLPEMNYEEKGGRLSPGERLLLYSDGLIEAHNPQGEMYGFPRLRSKLLAITRMGVKDGAQATIDYLLDDLEKFTGPDWEQEDDVTFVALVRE